MQSTPQQAHYVYAITSQKVPNASFCEKLSLILKGNSHLAGDVNYGYFCSAIFSKTKRSAEDVQLKLAQLVLPEVRILKGHPSLPEIELTPEQVNNRDRDH
jgi:hypothetical protein